MRRLATVAAFGFEAFDPPRVLAAYRRLGCTSCQVLRSEHHPVDASYIMDAAAEAGLAIDSIHGWFGPTLDPSSLDETERARAVDVYKADGEFAASLGGPIVVIHPGGPAPRGYEPTPSDRRKHFDQFRRSLEELTRIGEELGVTYVWENLPDDAWVGNDPIQIAECLRELDAPWARMCFDTGHANMTGGVADRLAACADVIGYFHIHDNDGTVDDHRMPGEGNIDWSAVRRAMSEHELEATRMLELFLAPEQIDAAVEQGKGEQFKAWLAV